MINRKPKNGDIETLAAVSWDLRQLRYALYGGENDYCVSEGSIGRLKDGLNAIENRVEDLESALNDLMHHLGLQRKFVASHFTIVRKEGGS